MPTEYIDISLDFADGCGGWVEAKITYEYEYGAPDSWDEPGWPASATGVSIEFRHPAPKGQPALAWAPNPLLEQLVDTERLRDWLVAQCEGAAEEYAYDMADHLYEMAAERRYLSAAE